MLSAPEALKSDSEIIDWLGRNHTLHRGVEVVYVVDGYTVEIIHDGVSISDQWHGKTVREAYSKAMSHWDKTHGNVDLLNKSEKA